MLTKPAQTSHTTPGSPKRCSNLLATTSGSHWVVTQCCVANLVQGAGLVRFHVRQMSSPSRRCHHVSGSPMGRNPSRAAIPMSTGTIRKGIHRGTKGRRELSEVPVVRSVMAPPSLWEVAASSRIPCQRRSCGQELRDPDPLHCQADDCQHCYQNHAEPSLGRRGGPLRERPHQRKCQQQVANVAASCRCGQEEVEGVETSPGADLWTPGPGAAAQDQRCRQADDGEQDCQADGAASGPCVCRELGQPGQPSGGP